MKKIVVLGLCLLSAAGVFAGGGAESGGQGKSVLKLASYFAESHPASIVMNETFKPMVEKNSGGTITVELYPNNMLGAEAEFIDGIKMGNIEMGLIGTMLSSQFPALMCIEFPSLFNSAQEASDILNTMVEDICAGMETANIKGLGVSINGVRAVSNSVRPINTFEDMKGLKLRVPQVEHYVDMGKVWNVNGVTMPMSELFTAMQQHTIDGQENPPTTVLASGWFEVQKYIAVTNHCVAGNMVVVGKRYWDSLTPANQKVVQDAVQAFVKEETALYIKNAEADIETLKSKGLTITYPDTRPFIDSMKPVLQKYMDKYPDLKRMVQVIESKRK
ncbi:MAG: TRAP transporter substrate-binding protein [Spirochaetales bacterium]|jgi:tripartite ATP-independent transporter DctP family solute receptor|nr:TRAP transporter substrate-binding protein [Spirochaetales bacterium]